jgi:DNA-binding MarR family transcriptional regulator
MNKKREKSIDFDRSENKVHLLHEIMKVHQALLAIFSRQVGLPPSKLALLRLLAISYPEGIGVMELAKKLGVNAAAVTRQVKEIEAQRIVCRIQDTKDARRNYVKLTTEGVQTLEKFHKRSHEFEGQICDAIDPDDLAVAIRVLTQIKTAIGEQ